MNPILFAQLTKVDEEKRLVFGEAASETVDKADEIMDYEKSKPHFKKWSEEVAADTGGKSLGNLRAMHGKVAAGKLTDIQFDDGNKRVLVCAKVVDNNEWDKVMQGVYTGFSIGGAYGDTSVEKMDGREVKRYTAIPNELSLVDRPCIPTAKFFEVRKADGTLAKVEFKTPEPEEATVQGTPEEVDEFCRVLKARGMSMKDAIEVLQKRDFSQAQRDEAAKTGAAMPDGSFPIKNEEDLHNAIRLAGKAKNPVAARAHIKERAKAMGMESAIPDDWGKAEQPDGLKKDASPDVNAGAEGNNGSTAQAKTKPSGAVDTSKSKGEGDGDGTAKAETNDGDEDDVSKKDCVKDDDMEMAEKVAKAREYFKEDVDSLRKSDVEIVKLHKLAIETEPLRKMIEAAVAPLQKVIAEQAEKIAKLEAQPAPTTVRLRAVPVAKTQDVIAAEADDKLAKLAAPVKDSAGDSHEAAGLIKAVHAVGGVPLTAPFEYLKKAH